MTTSILIVDPQNDFHEGGSLGIPGANEDAARVASFLSKNSNKLSSIVVTLDSHHPPHIAHAAFWVGQDGKHPGIFTLISSQDVKDEVWVPKDPEKKAWAEQYTTKLEENGRFQLCIWPEHCIMGTAGHNVKDVISKELNQWSRTTLKAVNYVIKGQNLLTESYSALQADVPIPSDPTTMFNEPLMADLLKNDKLIVCGQALSHCVNFTMQDVVSRWPKDKMHNVILLTDGTSSVPGFGGAGTAFVEQMKKLGVTLTTTTELNI